MPLSDLEKAAALQILAYLNKKGEASRTDLRQNIDAAIKTIYSTLRVLMKLSLIEEISLERFPFTVKIRLTEKGQSIAEHLVEIEKILEG